MKSFFVSIILCLIPTFAFAEWEFVNSFLNNESAKETVDVYIDQNSIVKNQNLRRFWVLKNYFVNGVENNYSKAERYEADCFEQTLQKFETVLYKSSMGKGEIWPGPMGNIKHTDSTKESIIPNTVGSTWLKVVCKD